MQTPSQRLRTLCQQPGADPRDCALEIWRAYCAAPDPSEFDAQIELLKAEGTDMRLLVTREDIDTALDGAAQWLKNAIRRSDACPQRRAPNVPAGNPAAAEAYTVARSRKADPCGIITKLRDMLEELHCSTDACAACDWVAHEDDEWASCARCKARVCEDCAREAGESCAASDHVLICEECARDPAEDQPESDAEG